MKQKEIRVRWYPTDIDETFDGTVISETDRIYVVVPDNSDAPTQNWDKRRCEVIDKPSIEAVKAIAIELGKPVECSDEELQADIDDFFDHEAAKKYEEEHPEEVADSRRIFQDTVELLQSDEFWKRSWKDQFTQDDGKYINTCAICSKPFMGHKRVAACVECTNSNNQPAADAAQ